MQCPFCKEEMQQGHISLASEPICFFPGNETMPATRGRWNVPKNAIRLGSFSMLDGILANAQYCQKCQKVIVDVK